MNTATGYTRVNLTIPKDIIEYLKHHTENMSNYITILVRRSESASHEKSARRPYGRYLPQNPPLPMLGMAQPLSGNCALLTKSGINGLAFYDLSYRH